MEIDKKEYISLLKSRLKEMNIYKGDINCNIDMVLNNSLLYANNVLFEEEITKKDILNGFIEYKTKLEDSVFSIVSKFRTTIDVILEYNKGINMYNIEENTTLLIPITNIVPTDIEYGYNIMKLNIESLKRLYPFLETGSIGKSELGKEISYIRIGKGKKELCYSAAIHANEWITSILLMTFVEEFCKVYTCDGEICNYRAKEIFEDTSIYIIPMINPDGVDLVNEYIEDEEILRKTKEISSKYPDVIYKKGWKANINGIDLNLQFPAGWERAKTNKFLAGICSKAPRDYVGIAPLIASEARALYDFTKSHDFKLILSYHSQGRVIYHKYLDYNPECSDYIGGIFADLSGYELEETPNFSGFAGYKDFFIQEYNRPGFTIEVGCGESPVDLKQFNKIYNENINILIIATRIV